MAVAKQAPEECPRCRQKITALSTMTAPKVDKQSGITSRAMPKWLCSECGHHWDVDKDLSQVWLGGLFEGPRTVTPTRHIRRAGAR